MTDFDNGWLYETSVGENRAIFVESGQLTKIRIERWGGEKVSAGCVVDAVFKRQWVPGKSGIVEIAGGEEVLLQPLPTGLTEGAGARIETTREAIHEPGGRYKRAKAKPASNEAKVRDGPSLLRRISLNGNKPHHLHSHDTDLFTEFGWHEAMEQAETGRIAFDGGALLISLTPAMTVIDVDGPLSAVELAKRAAREIALAIVRFDIGGNIGIDFPTIEAKSDRNLISKIFDDNMMGDCERTAINGFGFMQVVRKKVRRSTLEIVQQDRIRTAMVQLFRTAERDRGAGELTLNIHPAIDAIIQAQPAWLHELSLSTGRMVEVKVDGKIPIQGGFVK